MLSNICKVIMKKNTEYLGKLQVNVITRSLLNTAKLIEDNKLLFKLKEMEYVEKIAEISVSGNGNMVKQLKEIFSVSI